MEVRSIGAELLLPEIGSCKKLNGNEIGFKSGKFRADVLEENFARFTLRSIGASCTGGDSAVLFREIRGGDGEGDECLSMNDWAGRDCGDDGFDNISFLEAGGGREEAGEGGLDGILRISGEFIFGCVNSSLFVGIESSMGRIPGYNNWGYNRWYNWDACSNESPGWIP